MNRISTSRNSRPVDTLLPSSSINKLTQQQPVHAACPPDFVTNDGRPPAIDITPPAFVLPPITVQQTPFAPNVGQSPFPGLSQSLITPSRPQIILMPPTETNPIHFTIPARTPGSETFVVQGPISDPEPNKEEEEEEVNRLIDENLRLQVRGYYTCN